MAVAGTLNSWNTAANMQLNGDNEWVLVTNLNQSVAIDFKFAANGGWANSWGHQNAGHTTNAPVTGVADTLSDNNIRLPGPFSGSYRFVFNDRTLVYRVERANAVIEPFELLPPVMHGTQLILQWPGQAGATYTVERSTDLKLPNGGFSPYVSNLPADAVMNVITVNVQQVDLEFYRIRGE
jgi:hypothetical protein